MASTQIASSNITDGGVKRDDLNINAAGQAVIRKVIKGTAITITFTGTDDGTGDVTINSNPECIVFLAAAPKGNGYEWTNMPSALTEFAGLTLQRLKFDCSKFVSARLTVRVMTAGYSTAKIRAQYSTDESTWYYLDELAGPSCGISAAGTAVSSAATLASGAKADVYLRIVGIDGDGVVDPEFGMITLQLW